MPDLLDLVEEVKATKTPRELKRDDKLRIDTLNRKLLAKQWQKV